MNHLLDRTIEESAVNLADWSISYRPKSPILQPALFLDRDGVVIQDMHYIRRADDVQLIDGVAGTIRRFREAGFAVVVVTNQSGIARGYFDRNDYLAVEERIAALLGDDVPDAVYACPFHTSGQPPFNIEHSWRKPNDGMLQAAAADMFLDLSRSFMVGDRLSDIQAGLSAGVRKTILVLTGIGKRERLKVEQFMSPDSEAYRRISFADSIAEIPEVFNI